MWEQYVTSDPKKENHRTRLTVVYYPIEYPREVSTPTSDLTTMQIHVNSVISNIKSWYMFMDIRYVYLNNSMDRAEYILIQLSMIPREFINVYNLKYKVHNGYIFARLTKVIYGLPYTEWIAHNSLVQNLSPYVYHPSIKTQGLCTHDSFPINYNLVFNYFGVKYSGNEHALQLKAVLEYKYEVTTDCDEKLYIGISLQLYYEKGPVQISMLVYLHAALHLFQHKKPKRPQYSPYPWTRQIFI